MRLRPIAIATLLAGPFSLLATPVNAQEVDVTCRNDPTAGTFRCGDNATASQPQATAVGVLATASSSEATAVGRLSFASGAASTAIGYGTGATNDSATAVGYGSQAWGTRSTAVGYQTLAE